MSAASTDELLAVHEELLTLVRAGLPLDHGLKEFVRDLPAGRRPLLSDLAAQLAQGQDVSAALASVSSPSARVYTAVLALGMKAGRPAAALEGIVTTARRSQGYGRALTAELIYPAVVLIVGTALIVFSLGNTAAIQVAANEGLAARGPFTVALDVLAQPASWIALLLTSAAGLAAFWLVPRWVGGSPLTSGDYWRPLGKIRLWQSLAIFYDHLALLLENHVPLPQALELASEATAWSPLARAGRVVGQRIAQGETKFKVEWPLPPLAGWLLQRPSAGTLPAALRREAEHCRRRCDRLQRWFSVYFPALATLAVGMICLLLLVVINLGPLLNMYHHLSVPS